MSHGGQVGGSYIHGGAPDQSASWNMAVQQIRDDKSNSGKYGQGIYVIAGALIVFVMLISLPYLLDKLQEHIIVQRNKSLIANTQSSDIQQSQTPANSQVNSANSNPVMSNAFGEIGNVIASTFGIKSMLGTSNNQGNSRSTEQVNPEFGTAENMTQGEQDLAPTTSVTVPAPVSPYRTAFPGFRTNAQGYQVYLPNSAQPRYVQPPVAQVPVSQQAYYSGNYASTPANLGNVAITSPIGVRGNRQYAMAAVSAVQQGTPAYAPNVASGTGNSRYQANDVTNGAVNMSEYSNAQSIFSQIGSHMFSRHGFHFR